LQSWRLWATLVIPIASVCGLKGTRQKQQPSNNSKSRTLALLSIVAWMSRSILMSGNAYQIGHLVSFVALAELLFEAWDRLA
jgi:hypothetical protein